MTQQVSLKRMLCTAFQSIIPAIAHGVLLAGSTGLAFPSQTLSAESLPDRSRLLLNHTVPGIGDWGHEYQYALLRSRGKLLVQNPDGSLVQLKPGVHANGSLSRLGDEHIWTKPDGSILVFYGSHLVRMTKANGTQLKLKYRQGKLQSIKDDRGLLMSFDYQGKRIQTMRHRDGQRIQFSYDRLGQLHRATDEDGETTSVDPLEKSFSTTPTCVDTIDCHSDGNKVGHSRSDALSIAESLYLDIAIDECTSYFQQYKATDRGALIEKALNNHPFYGDYTPTVRSFPIADFHSPISIRVVRSRDLTLKTYGNDISDALYKQLLTDAREIEAKLLNPIRESGSITIKEQGGSTTLHQQQTRKITLDLVVQHGVATASQRAQLIRARHQLLNTHGITLQIIEIP